VPVRVKVVGQTHFLPARTVDLSTGGAALRMNNPPPPGSAILLEVYLPGAGSSKVVRAEGVVIWVSGESGEDASGIGIRFTKLSDEDRERIGTVVRETLVLGGEASMLGVTTPEMAAVSSPHSNS